MKSKNYVIYGDQETLVRLKEECDFIGRSSVLYEDRLVVLAIEPRPEKKKQTRSKRNGR